MSNRPSQTDLNTPPLWRGVLAILFGIALLCGIASKLGPMPHILAYPFGVICIWLGVLYIKNR